MARPMKGIDLAKLGVNALPAKSLNILSHCFTVIFRAPKPKLMIPPALMDYFEVSTWSCIDEELEDSSV